MAWVWLGGIACWAFACSALLAAFSTFDALWVLLLVGAAGVTLGWLGLAVAFGVKRRWNRRFLLSWAAWPLAVGVVGLLYATEGPMTLRVVVSQGALSEFVEDVRTSGRTRGRAGLVWVFDAKADDRCVFLHAGTSLDGIAGLATRTGQGPSPGISPGRGGTSRRAREPGCGPEVRGRAPQPPSPHRVARAQERT